MGWGEDLPEGARGVVALRDGAEGGEERGVLAGPAPALVARGEHGDGRVVAVPAHLLGLGLVMGRLRVRVRVMVRLRVRFRVMARLRVRVRVMARLRVRFRARLRVRVMARLRVMG